MTTIPLALVIFTAAVGVPATKVVVPPPDMHVGLHVDPATIPPRKAGVSEERITNSGKFATPTDIGQFRTVCYFSHAGWDDPIVMPGKPNASHLHYFFGNGQTNAFTTLADLREGTSTCRGGAINLTSYWQPAMIDMRTARAIAPQSSVVYYKQGYRLPTGPFASMPEGLKMVAGDPKGQAPSGIVHFTCQPENWTTDHIGPCPVGSVVWASVTFPQCWDGKNLDSPDHRSHMAYPAGRPKPPFGWFCPASHPVKFPEVVVSVLYPVRTGDDTKYWRVVSDTYDLSKPGGYSLHADWFGAWKPVFMDLWTKLCINATMECGASMLGDGRTMDEFNGN
jgi:Domain of unknown function (DUF1996)